MTILDTYNNLTPAQLIDPDLHTDDDANVDSAVFDRQGELGSVLLLALVGASADTLSGSVKVNIILMHGDESDGSDQAAVTDANHVEGTFETIASGIYKVLDAEGDEDALYAFGYKGPKRYVSVRMAHVGTFTNGIHYGVAAVAGPKRQVGALAV